MSVWGTSWDGTDASGQYYAEHVVSLQDTADIITYEVAGKVKLIIDVFEFERLCAELAKFEYIDWPRNEGDLNE